LESKTLLNELINQCIENRDIVKRIELLQHLNRLLPTEYKIEIPSYITNCVIDNKLYLLQETEMISRDHSTVDQNIEHAENDKN
jgi:hypothetical protein